MAIGKPLRRRYGSADLARLRDEMVARQIAARGVKDQRVLDADVADPRERVSFHRLDLYSLDASIRAVLDYLDRVYPEAAAVARERYGCLSRWQREPAIYGRTSATLRPPRWAASATRSTSVSSAGSASALRPP